MTNVALFGGSFNPPHTDHKRLLEDLAQDPNFNEIWVAQPPRWELGLYRARYMGFPHSE